MSKTYLKSDHFNGGGSTCRPAITLHQETAAARVSGNLPPPTAPLYSSFVAFEYSFGCP